MKNIKTYLTLALAIASCASINIFAMEPEISNTSGEWSEEDLPNISSELGNDKNILREQINDLQNILNMANHKAEYEITTDEEYNLLIGLIHIGETALTQAIEMLQNRIPINIAFIDEQISSIQSIQTEIETLNKHLQAQIEARNKHLLEVQIKKLQDIINTIKNTLKYDKNISNEEYDHLKGLINHAEIARKTANGMILNNIPVSIAFIEQKIRAIITRWNEILLH
jgi:hypothetical protein